LLLDRDDVLGVHPGATGADADDQAGQGRVAAVPVDDDVVHAADLVAVGVAHRAVVQTRDGDEGAGDLTAQGEGLGAAGGTGPQAGAAWRRRVHGRDGHGALRTFGSPAGMRGCACRARAGVQARRPRSRRAGLC